MSELLPGTAQLAVFAAAVFVLNATPGVDFLLTVSRTLRGGPRSGLAAALGISAGCVLHVLAAGFGLAALLAVNRGAFTLVQWAGAAYLAWLGLGLLRQAWRAGPAAAPTAAAASSRPWASDFRAGVFTNLLNPKVALFFLAFLPQFVPSATPHPTLSFLLLGLLAVLQGTLFLMALVLLAARLQALGANARVGRLLGAAGGLMFIGLALRLLRERPLGA